VRLWLVLLLACCRLAGQAQVPIVEPRDFYKLVEASGVHAVVIESGHVVWQRGKITARACEAPVIAERIPKAMLDSPAPIPPGATMRQVLENRADGTPGEEVLENREFREHLDRPEHLPQALAFAKQQHQPLGWFIQEYGGKRILWCHSPAVLIVQVPEKKMSLVVSPAPSVEDINVLRSSVALMFLQEVAMLGKPDADNAIDAALDALAAGDREAAASLARKALDRFPELENSPDVSLLHLFSRLGLPETEASATAVIKVHPSLPTAWFYYGQYVENRKRYREAAACYDKILLHQPPWHNWTVEAARKELKYLRTN